MDLNVSEVIGGKSCPGCEEGHFKTLLIDLSQYTDDVSLRSFFHNARFKPGFRSVIWLRICQHLYSTGATKLAMKVRIKILKKYGLDFVPGACVDVGLRIEHPVGIVIGKKSVIGKNVTIMQNVTIGQKYLTKGSKTECPRIEDEVVIGAGATILGKITIGRGSVIGAGSIITKSVLPGQKVMGTH